MKVYDVESQGKYHIQVTEIDGIENAGEHFVTSDELKDMGITYVSSWGDGVQRFDKKIKKELTRLKNQIVKSGKKSCKIEDDELVECFTTGNGSTFVSDFVPGLRRVGNRLMLAPAKKEKTAPNKRDAKQFLGYAIRYINRYWNEEYGQDGNDFCLEIRGGLENCHEGAFRYVVHNMEWDEFVEWSEDEEGYHRPDEEDLPFFKMIYDNPEIFNTEEAE
jgi:hypothetical protein